MEQTKKFVAWMLGLVGQIDLAAAHYNWFGKVDELHLARMPVRNMADLNRVLPWLRQRNAAGFNIWIRPSASLNVSAIIMLDDLTPGRAQAVACKYSCAAVQTSPDLTQVWIVMERPLAAEQRQNVARSLARLVGGDLDSTSEPRWGRLPGFRQCKPGKAGWTNLLSVSNARKFDPSPYLVAADSLPPPGAEHHGAACSTLASAGSGGSEREFAFACHRLRSGWTPDRVIQAIAAHALARGKRRTEAQARQYAIRTVAKAGQAIR